MVAASCGADDPTRQETADPAPASSATSTILSSTTTTAAPTGSTSTSAPAPARDEDRRIELELFPVSLRVPGGWSHELEPGAEVLSGPDDGRVHIAAYADGDLDRVVSLLTDHHLRPFGSAPTVTEFSVQGAEGALIEGSNDAPVPAESTAAALTMPVGALVNGTVYRTLVLTGDRDAVIDVAGSIEWRPGSIRIIESIDPDGSYLYVQATEAGVELRAVPYPDEAELIPVGPTHLAFVAGGVLVHEGALGVDALDSASGELFITDAEGTRPLDIRTDPDSTHLELLDAVVIDERPWALIESVRGAGPEHTEDRLLLVALDDLTVRDLGGFGGWEAGVDSARIVDGRIAVVRTAEALWWIEVIDHEGRPIWASAEWLDQRRLLSADDSIVQIHNQVWNGLTPGLDTTIYVLHTGEVVRSTTRFFAGDDATLDGACLRFDAGLCSSPWRVPVWLDHELGLFPFFDSRPIGMVTLVRDPVSSALTPMHPCGLRQPSYPHDITPTGVHDLGDGIPLGLILYIEDGSLAIQGNDGERYTNRLVLPLPATDIGNDAVVIVDGVINVVGESAIALVEFDGCELASPG